ncbi:hypothetical protein Gotri_000670 [Gossypium trilobum]|uniref:Uncharacterized protein n=1 Tax=Gossypium trilobum TaxID=34281 RepID=A0A7J9FC57_9ROSI|nr:hypothetical protein [Gossypium trilobum]
MTKVLISQNIGKSSLHVVTPLLNVATTKNSQNMKPTFDVTTSLRDGISAKIDYQLASFNVSVSSPVVEFQEGNMNKYFQQLKPYTFIQ